MGTVSLCYSIIAGVPPKQNLDLEGMLKKPEEIETLSPTKKKEHMLEILAAKRRNNALTSDRPTFLLRLQVAKDFYDCSHIFFPHSVDFRGRAYPVPPHLNHQGPDICRGLLEFAETKPLGERGLYWMKIQLANLAGKDKLTLAKRIEWADENTEKIRAVADAPLAPENLEFWAEAEDPWQFLANCFEWDNAHNYPGGPEK